MELSEQDYALLSAYIDEALSDAERTEIEKRLASEEALRQELAALRQVVALVGDMPTLQAPRDFTLSREQIAALNPPRGRILTLTPLLSAAASFALMFLGLVMLLSASGPMIGDVFSNVTSNFGSDVGGAGDSVAAAPSPTDPMTEAAVVQSLELTDMPQAMQTVTTTADKPLDEAAELNESGADVGDEADADVDSSAAAEIMEAEAPEDDSLLDQYGMGDAADASPFSVAPGTLNLTQTGIDALRGSEDTRLFSVTPAIYGTPFMLVPEEEMPSVPASPLAPRTQSPPPSAGLEADVDDTAESESMTEAVVIQPALTQTAPPTRIAQDLTQMPTESASRESQQSTLDLSLLPGGAVLALGIGLGLFSLAWSIRRQHSTEGHFGDG